MKILTIIIILLACMPAMLLADVIRLQNGDVYLGKITNTDSEGVNLESFGRNIKVSHKDILRTEKDMSLLKNQDVEIILKDESNIRGKIQNFDDEVGVLVNIDFGSLTLPAKSIKSITEPSQKEYYAGKPFVIGISGGYYMVNGPLKKNFNDNMLFTIYGEANTDLIRGLFAGVELNYMLMDNKFNSNLKYNIYNSNFYASYRFFNFRTSSGFIRNFVPYGSFGIGLSYVAANDSRSNVPRKKSSEMDLNYKASLGFDYFLTKSVSLRVSSSWQSILQDKNNFNMLMFNIGAGYNF
jgi:small nuclear ribonucleoprotein (snRNP)-like protein